MDVPAVRCHSTLKMPSDYLEMFLALLVKTVLETDEDLLDLFLFKGAFSLSEKRKRFS